MTDRPKLFQALVTYALVAPVAVMLGYLLAEPNDFFTFISVSLIFVLLGMPLLLRWHLPLLFLLWNTTVVVFFLPGHPPMWILAAFGSLGFSLVRRTILRDMRFIYVPSLLMPVLFL